MTEQVRRCVAVLAPEPIRPRMAGMGIRALEIARSLREEFDVRLLVPNDPAEASQVASGIPVVAAPPAELASAARGAQVAVVSGHGANWWFHQVPDLPVAVDLYDPFPIENLHYARTLGEETADHDRTTLELAMARADFFLCASEEQRLFYAGALYAAGRIGPRNFPEDPTLQRLLCVVPFGVPEEPAAGDSSEGRRAAGLPEKGPVVLFGGIYDWYEPDLLLEAWPSVLDSHPQARLLFFENPNRETTPQKVYASVRERARALDPEGRSIFFSPWLPYKARADLYAAVDLLVVICSEGLETDLAYRTRLLDAAWGGVPFLSVGGGRLAQELEKAGAGRQIAQSPGSLAQGLNAFLGDPALRAESAAAARRFAARRSWRLVTAPLAAWCRQARCDANRLLFPREGKGVFWRRMGRRLFFR